MKCKVMVRRNDENNIILVNNMLFNALQLDKYQSILIQFGLIKARCTVQIDPFLKKNTVAIPMKIKGFTIPLIKQYECMIKKDTFVIGPVIGIMGCRDSKYLTSSLLSKLIYRLKDSWKVRGLFFVFAENEVNHLKKEIKGFYYHTKKQCWIEGMFPFPNSVMMSKISMSQKSYRLFIKEIGQNVFYNAHLSKWYQHKMLSSHPTLSKNLPFTLKLSSRKSFLRMLNQFGTVYLKPNRAYQGRGIVTIERIGRAYLLKNTYGQTKILDKQEDLIRYVKNKVKQKYLIQQAIPFSINKSRIDFRLYLQKNKEKQWVSPGIMARVGKKGSII